MLAADKGAMISVRASAISSLAASAFLHRQGSASYLTLHFYIMVYKPEDSLSWLAVVVNVYQITFSEMQTYRLGPCGTCLLKSGGYR